MKIHVLLHVPFEGPANILKWAALKGHSVTATPFFEPQWSLPSTDNVDLLIIMGGPMGVYDEAEYPWLIKEKAFIRDCIDAGRAVFGICLGAQLAAEVLGAKVYPNGQKEIGWFPLEKTSIPHPVLFDMAPDQMVFHWHGDTFDLPKGALLLASSEACKHQAFIWNEQVLGFQFHMEMSGEHIDLLIQNCFQDLKDKTPFVQSGAEIEKGYGHAEVLSPLLDSILTRFMS